MPLGGRTATGSSIAPWRAIGEAGGAPSVAFAPGRIAVIGARRRQQD